MISGSHRVRNEYLAKRHLYTVFNRLVSEVTWRHRSSKCQQ